MPTLICDLDGVIFDFDRTWVERHRAWWPGSSLEPGMPQRWGDIYQLSGLGPVLFWEWWRLSGGWAGMEVHEGAVEALNLAHDRGWLIGYATNRALPDEQSLTAMQRIGLPQASYVIHTPSKWDLPATLFVEDAPDNLMRMHWAATTLRVERPWNDLTLYPELAPIPSIPDLTPHTLLPWLAEIEGRVPR